ncbi:variable surface protein, partial [Plasmodium gonderi]
MVAQLEDDDLNKLPSKQKYANFNNPDVRCNDASFYKYVESGLNKEKWQKDVSEQILNSLCYIYKKYKSENFNSDDCDYLYYWLNYIIYSNITYQLHSIRVITILDFLLQNNDGRNICHDNKFNVNKENYRDIKLLFDFSRDYDTLKNYFNNGYRFCNSDFQKYVNEYIITFNTFNRDCKKQKSSEETCIAFNEYFKDKKDQDLSEWKCNVGVSTDRLISTEGNHENQEELSEPDIVHHGEEKKKLQQETLRTEEESAFTGSIFRNSNVHIGHSKLRSNIDNKNNSSAFKVSKAMTIGSLVIGITVFSIFFYN